MDWSKISNGKPAAVFGLARSGLATVKALVSAGVNVVAWDDNETARAEAKGATLAELTAAVLKDCAFLVLAPGVPLHYPKPHPVVLAAREAGIEIICDIELFGRLNHGRKTVGITGTNGKSTTTALIHHILSQAGVDSAMGGNIGKAVFDLKMPSKDGIFVLELSSYQLDLCSRFHPDIAVLLNITPDHIDRHGTMEQYAAAKEKIFEGPGVAVVGVDDSYSRAMAERIKNRKIIRITIKDDVLRKSLEGSVLKGDHNYQNALAAFAVCTELGVAKDKIIEGLKTFPGLPHRQFPVRAIGKVTYINDSKATNAEAAEKALSAFEHIFWIAGGRAKDGGLKGLEIYKDRILHSFLIGESANDFAAWMIKNKIPHEKSGMLETAVARAHEMAQERGESAVVLLSPACASFDQFSSYEERGEVFTKLVQGLKS